MFVCVCFLPLTVYLQKQAQLSEFVCVCVTVYFCVCVACKHKQRYVEFRRCTFVFLCSYMFPLSLSVGLCVHVRVCVCVGVIMFVCLRAPHLKRCVNIKTARRRTMSQHTTNEAPGIKELI